MTLTPEELDRLSKMTLEERTRTMHIDDHWSTQTAFKAGIEQERQLSEWRKTQKEASEPRPDLYARVEFRDHAGKEFLINRSESSGNLWLYRKHVDGGWVSMREITEDEAKFMLYNDTSVPNEQTPKQEEILEIYPRCKACNGLGRHYGDRMDCDACNGTGSLRQEIKAPVESPRKE